MTWLTIGGIYFNGRCPMPRVTCAAAERFSQVQPDRPAALKIGIHHGAAFAWRAGVAGGTSDPAGHY